MRIGFLGRRTGIVVVGHVAVIVAAAVVVVCSQQHLLRLYRK